MAKLLRKNIDVPKDKVIGIEKLFGQMLNMDVNNIPAKYKKAFDTTKGIAYDTFTMKAIYESYELGEVSNDCLTLRNGTTISSKVMAEVFNNSFELVFYVVTLHGYEAADEAEDNMFNKLLLDHWGTAFIECADSWVGKTIAKTMEEEGVYTTYSFSPGQSDISLEMQTPIFDLLMPSEIGVCISSEISD